MWRPISITYNFPKDHFCWKETIHFIFEESIRNHKVNYLNKDSHIVLNIKIILTNLKLLLLLVSSKNIINSDPISHKKWLNYSLRVRWEIKNLC